MNNRRQQGIDRLAKAAIEGDNKSCIQALFEVIYGLPKKILLELTRKVMQYHMGLFVESCSEGEWLGKILDNPNGYCKLNGRNRPYTSTNISLDCQEYYDSAVDGLLLAHYQQENINILSAASTYAIFSTIKAVQMNEWKKIHKASYEKFEMGAIYQRTRSRL